MTMLQFCNGIYGVVLYVAPNPAIRYYASSLVIFIKALQGSSQKTKPLQGFIHYVYCLLGTATIGGVEQYNLLSF